MLNCFNMHRQHTVLEALVFAVFTWLVVLLGALAMTAAAVPYFSSVFEATGSQAFFYGVVATHAVCAGFTLLASLLAAQVRDQRVVPLVVLLTVLGFVLSSCFGSPAAVLAPTLICLLPMRKDR